MAGSLRTYIVGTAGRDALYSMRVPCPQMCGIRKAACAESRGGTRSRMVGHGKFALSCIKTSPCVQGHASRRPVSSYAPPLERRPPNNAPLDSNSLPVQNCLSLTHNPQIPTLTPLTPPERLPLHPLNLQPLPRRAKPQFPCTSSTRTPKPIIIIPQISQQALRRVSPPPPIPRQLPLQIPTLAQKPVLRPADVPSRPPQHSVEQFVAELWR